jgi:hypothetical protein
MTTGDEGAKPQNRTEVVLRAYMESIREFRLLDDAARAHLDRMLTWVIGLMGAGVLATASLRICPLRELIWASSPWVVGILVAVVGRLAGDLYRDHPGLRSIAEVFEAHLQLARGPDEESARDFFARTSDEPHLKRAERAQRIARWCYRAALILLAIGMLSIFRRVASC